jgi:hypothetical protein
MLPALKEAPGVPDTKLDLRSLDALMQKRLPDEKRVSAEAAASAGALGAWLGAVDKAPPWRSAQLARLLRDLAEDRTGLAHAAPSKDRPPATWDGATQLYLGLAAVHHGWSDQRAPRRGPAATKKALADLRRALEEAFPAGSASNIYDSPSKFRPGALEAPLKKLRAPRK